MSLLSEISKEQDRLKGLGYTPIYISLNEKTSKRLDREREIVFGGTEGKLLGMEVTKTISLPDGVFRLMLAYDNTKGYNCERY